MDNTQAPKKSKIGPPAGNKNAVGNNGGRPEIYSDQWLKEEAVALLEWFTAPRNIWLKGFALQRGYDPTRLDEFAIKSVEFSSALKKAKAMQEYKLVDMGLFKEIDSGLVKFTLTNNHGWTEKQQVSGDAANPLSCILERNDGRSKELVNGNG
ncbi:MAG: hypothetical protein JSR46_04555 [Verrucomicrobia bacterium]|nr:hypothetical protein [Verrucomicrobiota bacterium]